MDFITELESMRKRILREINTEFDILIEQMSTAEDSAAPQAVAPPPYEITYPITAGGIFKGTKPTAVAFGGEAPETVFNWKQLVETVMKKCVSDERYLEKLYSLSNRVTGRKRVLLSCSARDMRSPIEIADRLYMETHYDTETLLNILITKILMPIGYDYSTISVTIINRQ